MRCFTCIVGSNDWSGELYAERLRRQSEAAKRAGGTDGWTTKVVTPARVKLHLAWQDVLGYARVDEYQYAGVVERRIRQSLGAAGVTPDRIAIAKVSDEVALSLLEAEYQTLVQREVMFELVDPDESTVEYVFAADHFLERVNAILESHAIAFTLTGAGHIIPIESMEMHASVVAPVLHLLHSPGLAASETAYQKALQEIRNNDPGDAITDAATALQEALTALGCEGNSLGKLLASARDKELLGPHGSPLLESVKRIGDWVHARRSGGEAHRGDDTATLAEAWLVVHVVGALIIHLKAQATA